MAQKYKMDPVNQYLQDALALTECIEYHPLFVKQF